MTSRDIEIIDFVRKYQIATTDMINHFYFNSKTTCYKRLHYLYKNGYLKRIRSLDGNINSQYLYYIKLPKQIKHRLAIMEFYYRFDCKHKILDFNVQPQLNGLYPDALFTYQSGSSEIIAFLEVELSHKGFNYLKYESYYKNKNYKEISDYMPDVYWIGKGFIPSDTSTRFINVNLHTNNCQNTVT